MRRAWEKHRRANHSQVAFRILFTRRREQEIKQIIEFSGFSIIAQQKLQVAFEPLRMPCIHIYSPLLQLTATRAAEFYSEHEGKPFFSNLVSFMTSGPIWAVVLAKPGAIKAWRELMGPTNSIKAREEKPRCLRALYGADGTQNATHGSDSPASAAREIKFFFPTLVLDSTLVSQPALIPSSIASLLPSLSMQIKGTGVVIGSFRWLLTNPHIHRRALMPGSTLLISSNPPSPRYFTEALLELLCWNCADHADPIQRH